MPREHLRTICPSSAIHLQGGGVPARMPAEPSSDDGLLVGKSVYQPVDDMRQQACHEKDRSKDNEARERGLSRQGDKPTRCERNYDDDNEANPELPAPNFHWFPPRKYTVGSVPTENNYLTRKSLFPADSNSSRIIKVHLPHLLCVHILTYDSIKHNILCAEPTHEAACKFRRLRLRLRLVISGRLVWQRRVIN